MKVNNISIIGNRKKVRNSTFYWVWRVILVFQPTSKKIHDRARHSTENNIKLFTLNNHRNEKMLSSYITNFLVFFFWISKSELIEGNGLESRLTSENWPIVLVYQHMTLTMHTFKKSVQIHHSFSFITVRIPNIPDSRKIISCW